MSERSFYFCRLDSKGFNSMTAPNYEAAIEKALEVLRSELPTALTYHSAWHTSDDVLPAVRLLARMSGVTGEAYRLLEVAAAYHDIGFVYTLEEHERKGAAVVAELLPQFGFDAGRIARVQKIILATRLPNAPEDILEEIIADADLDLLGRDDFFERNAALHAELTNLGHNIEWDDWYVGQLKFLKGHRYFTAAAAKVRGAGKVAHIAVMKKKLMQMQSGG